MSARGQVIVASDAFDSKRAALGAINTLRRNAGEAQLVDETAAARDGREEAGDSRTHCRQEDCGCEVECPDDDGEAGCDEADHEEHGDPAQSRGDGRPRA